MFNWHTEARLFARGIPVPRPADPPALGFRALPSEPTAKTLAHLGEALMKDSAGPIIGHILRNQYLIIFCFFT